MDKKIVAVRLALTVVLAATLNCLELDLAYSLEDKVSPTDILSKQEALQNDLTIVTPLTAITQDSIAYVFSDRGDYRLDNNSVLSYNGSEILGTDLARPGNSTDFVASTNITAASLSKYLAGNVPLNRNLDAIYGNGTKLSHYPLVNYSLEEKLLLIYSLFDFLNKQEDNKASQLIYANDSDHLIEVVFSPDNETVALSSTALSGADNIIRLLDLQTEKELFNLTNCSPYGKMAFSPDGRMLASGIDGSIIRISDSRTGKELKNISQYGSVELLAFSPDGKVLASTGNLVGDTWIPMMWDINNNTVIGGNLNAYRSAKIRSEGHNERITDMAFNPNGQTLATSSYDNTTKIWSAKDGKLLFNLIHDGPVLGLTYSPDGKMLATASEDRTARIWDAENGTELFRLNHSGPVQTIAFDPKPFGGLGWVIVTVSSGNLTYWQASTGDAIGEIGFENSPFIDVVFSPEGVAAASSEDNLVRLFSEDLFTRVSTLNPNSTVKSTVFSPNGTDLAIVCDNSLLIWDLSSLFAQMNDATNNTSNETIPILISANNSSTLNDTQSGWQGTQYFIKISNESSNDPAILLSAFCEKLGIDARIIAEYGVSGEDKNIISNISSDNLHLYAEAYLGKLDSSERAGVERAVGQIKQRYNVSDVYSHVNLSTNDVWLNLDVASQYPGGPFKVSPKQMQVYVSSRGNNESYQPIDATGIKVNETPSAAIDYVPSIVNVNETASLDAFNSTDLVGYTNLKDSMRIETKIGKDFEAIGPSDLIESSPKSISNGNYGLVPQKQIASDFQSLKLDNSIFTKLNKKVISSQSDSVRPIDGTSRPEDLTKKRSTTPSRRSENDNDDRYKIAYKIAGTEHPVEAATEAKAIESRASTGVNNSEIVHPAKAMGDGIDSEVIRYFILKLMGLIAGGFIVIIATAYRGREPPMDDDDFDDIVSFKSNIDNKRSGR
jgi:WD40 repeat protein